MILAFLVSCFVPKCQWLLKWLVCYIAAVSCRYNPNTDRLELSYSRFKKSDLPVLGRLVLSVFRVLRLIDVAEGIGEDGEYTECSNMTIINLALRIVGPMHERRLTIYLLTFQVILSFFVFAFSGFPFPSTDICLVKIV